MNAGKGFHTAHANAHPVKTSVLRRAQIEASADAPVEALKRQLGDGPFALIVLLVAPGPDFQALMDAAREAFADTDITACTTAGEIGRAGYEEGQILAIGFPAGDFATASILLRDTDRLSSGTVVEQIARERLALQNRAPELTNAFAFLVVDGLSLSEDILAATVAPALSDMPMFGGSAGDGTDFEHTMVGLNTETAERAAVLTLIRSRFRTKVFSLDHMEPTEHKMVVTEADPRRRIVKSINAEPAAREYARIVGKDPEQLDRFTFAAHPVVVRIGNEHHVRAIQQVNDAGEMVFFSAVDEGMVLTVARPTHLANHLAQEMETLTENGAATDIFCCDCLLRRIEAEQTQMIRPMSQILSDNNVIGFSTYGEQIGPLHVNQTMSGVAFFATPEADG